jgi:hypothetical protein
VKILYECHRPLALAITAFLCLAAAELVAVLFVNGGGFSYTLDDPYIHLALAENILRGHYGVNLQEFSSPSSSVLWPFLLVPLVAFPHADLVLLGLNLLLSLGCLLLFDRVLCQADRAAGGLPLSGRVRFLFLLFFILASNLVGLNFLGMEHVLQLLVVLQMVSGLIRFSREGVVTPATWLAIVVAPLIRYECLAVSGAALLFFMLQRNILRPLVAGLLIGALLVAFSLFLLAIGQEYLPSSVLVKSAVVESGLGKLTTNLGKNFVFPQAWIMLGGLLLLVRHGCRKSLPLQERQLAAVSALAVFLHLMVGRFGWYFRYEIYMWVLEILVLLYLNRGYLKQAVVVERRKSPIVIGMLVFLIPLEFHVESIVYGPRAAGNIYYQQYQMRRFVVDYYRDSVAVNDLGWVSFGNDHYVLDLWGLASREAYKLRSTATSALWLVDITRQHDVGLVMIYHNEKYFPQLPESWIKIGELKLRDRKFTASDTRVHFFATHPEAVGKINASLQQFVPTLPSGSYFDDEDRL